MSETLAHPAPTRAHGLTWQKVILGDWSRVIRDPLDVARVSLLLSAIVWALLGLAMTGLIAGSAVIILARVISLPRFYDASVILVMFLLAWGSALFWSWSWGFYEHVVYF